MTPQDRRQSPTQALDRGQLEHHLFGDPHYTVPQTGLESELTMVTLL